MPPTPPLEAALGGEDHEKIGEVRMNTTSQTQPQATSGPTTRPQSDPSAILKAATPDGLFLLDYSDGTDALVATDPKQQQINLPTLLQRERERVQERLDLQEPALDARLYCEIQGRPGRKKNLALRVREAGYDFKPIKRRPDRHVVCEAIRRELDHELEHVQELPASLTVGSHCEHLADLMLQLAERFRDLALAMVGIPDWLEERLKLADRIEIIDLSDFAEPPSWERALSHSGSS